MADIHDFQGKTNPEPNIRNIIGRWIAAVSLGWWLDHRANKQHIDVLFQRMIELESDSQKWQVWTHHLIDQLNGTKVGGKWLFPWCYVLEPGADRMNQPMRQAPGDSVVSPSPVSPDERFEWRKEWAELR